MASPRTLRGSKSKRGWLPKQPSIAQPNSEPVGEYAEELMAQAIDLLNISSQDGRDQAEEHIRWIIGTSRSIAIFERDVTTISTAIARTVLK